MVRNLLALLAILFISFTGLGWYRGWYAVAPQEATEPGRSAFLVEFDRGRISQDIGDAVRSVQRWLSKENREEVEGSSTGSPAKNAEPAGPKGARAE